MIPLAVIVTTHNDSNTIRACLRSIDKTMRGRTWFLVVSDDASKDNTVELAREVDITCHHCVMHSWAKAASIAVAKNRAIGIYRTLASIYPWWTWVDGDDELLPGRLWLLEKAVEDGHLCAAGGHIDVWPNGRRDWVNIEELERGCRSAIWGMVLHRDCIPASGLFFDEELGDSVHDDLVAIHELRRRGHEWGVYTGVEVAAYHRHEAGFMHSGIGLEVRTQNTWKAMLCRPLPSVAEAFFTTICGDTALIEGEIALRTLRLFHTQPIVVVTDRPAIVESWNIVGVIARSDYAVNERFAHIAKLYQGPPSMRRFFTHCVARLISLRALFHEYWRVIAFDADFVFLREFPVLKAAWLTVAPHWRTFAPNPPNYFMHQFGLLNGGLVRICGDSGNELRPWIYGAIQSVRSFKDNWRTERHSFTDQGNLMDLAWSRMSDFATFPASCNLGASVIDGNEYSFDVGQHPHDIITMLHAITPLHLGHSLWYRGHSVRNIHAHLLGQQWNSPWSRIARVILQTCSDYTGIEAIVRDVERKHGITLDGGARGDAVANLDIEAPTPWGDAP